MPLSKIQTNSISSTANATFQNIVATRIGIGTAANTSYGLINRYGGNSELATQFGTGTIAGIGAYAVSGGVFVETAGVARKYPIQWNSTSGQVTMPFQPAFAAFSSNGASLTTSATLRRMPYANQITDVGSCYDEANSRFTAPIAGTYFFAASALLLGGGSGNLYFQKNGSVVSGSNGHNRAINGTNESNVAHSTIITLAANDYFEVWYGNDGGSNQWYGAHGAFCGHLIG